MGKMRQGQTLHYCVYVRRIKLCGFRTLLSSHTNKKATQESTNVVLHPILVHQARVHLKRVRKV